MGSLRLIGLPYDASSSYLRGPAQAPPLIRAALHSTHWNSWTEQGRDLSVPGMLTDAGDLPLSANATAREEIEAGIAGVLAEGARPIALGGDHSVTYPILRALAPRHRKLTILHIDAHPDLYDEYEGDRFSHACPFARIMEERLTHRLVQVGIRTMNPHQRSQADRFGVEVIDMRAWEAGGRPKVDGDIYLSVDLDGLDPAYAPGVSHREPGGLSVRDVLTLVQNSGGTLVGADVVEYNPKQDVAGVTALVAAKIVKEVAGHMLRATLALGVFLMGCTERPAARTAADTTPPPRAAAVITLLRVPVFYSTAVLDTRSSRGAREALAVPMKLARTSPTRLRHAPHSPVDPYL